MLAKSHRNEIEITKRLTSLLSKIGSYLGASADQPQKIMKRLKCLKSQSARMEESLRLLRCIEEEAAALTERNARNEEQIEELKNANDLHKEKNGTFGVIEAARKLAFRSEVSLRSVIIAVVLAKRIPELCGGSRVIDNRNWWWMTGSAQKDLQTINKERWSKTLAR